MSEFKPFLEVLTDDQLYSMIYGKLHSSTRWGYSYKGKIILEGTGSVSTNKINSFNLKCMNKSQMISIVLELFENCAK